MHIAIVSDTHGRTHTVAAALRFIAERGAEMVLHCGDIDDGATVRQFADIPTQFVFGNCDGDRALLRKAVSEIGAQVHEPFGHLHVEGIDIAWVHGDDHRLFRELESSGAFDFLFYGHTHHAEQHRRGPTQVINPGALYRARIKTFVLLDTSSGEVESMTVE